MSRIKKSLKGILHICEGLGKLGKDREMKYTPSGTAMCNFSIATEERWTDNGEKKSRTDRHRVTARGKLAEICGEYFHKGSQD
jgi:single-strand DNA-binding protein